MTVCHKSATPKQEKKILCFLSQNLVPFITSCTWSINCGKSHDRQGASGKSTWFHKWKYMAVSMKPLEYTLAVILISRYDIRGALDGEMLPFFTSFCDKFFGTSSGKMPKPRFNCPLNNTHDSTSALREWACWHRWHLYTSQWGIFMGWTGSQTIRPGYSTPFMLDRVSRSPEIWQGGALAFSASMETVLRMW